MSDESEKRFHSIMDKLLLAPPKSLSSSLRGTKRPNPSSSLSHAEPRFSGSLVSEARQSLLSEAPMCRPWDRGDLMARLATFKSMTWFAKPEAVSALNCARRGWTNVDIDTISCEACGARFLFPTPSSWNQHQVEKAAAVFSLKLDKGHKLLCPWADNVCDEMLSQFPPTALPILVEKFRERCDALSRLSALPVISSSAIDFMRSPQLEKFLEQSFTLEHENGSADRSRVEFLGEDYNVDSEKYYQAQKLISLCGWEPRVLPYVVDSGSKFSQTLSVDLQSDKIQELTDANVNSSDSNRPRCDPNSVVLDCKLCGATVGLWAFARAPCPMELVRLVGYAEINGGGQSSDSATPSIERRRSSNFSIAGGPPPAKQNFKATVSFPVIGRNLRARFCDDSMFSGDYGKGNESDTSVKAIGVEGNNDSTLLVSASDCNMLQLSGSIAVNNLESPLLPFCLEGDVEIDMNDLFGQTPSDENANDQEDGGGNLQITDNNELDSSGIEKKKELKQATLEQAMEFDPIRQHRHFCPWVSSTYKSPPGWKQTQSALLRQKGYSPSSEKSPSTSIIKVDDPITSVRNLFTSPSPKRIKVNPSSQN